MIIESYGTSSASVSATRSRSESRLCSESTWWKTSASRRYESTGVPRSPAGTGSGSGKIAGEATVLRYRQRAPGTKGANRLLPRVPLSKQVALGRHHELPGRSLAQQVGLHPSHDDG